MPDLEDIYIRHRDFVFRICRRYARSRDDAEDLTQDTLIKVADRLDRFREESELRTWIYRVAVNVCLDHLRKCRRQDRNLENYLDEMVVRNLDSGGDRVLARLELDRILSPFRPAVRRILFLTLAEGLTYAEAADVLGMTSAAVAKTVHRFLAKGKSGVFSPESGESGAPRVKNEGAKSTSAGPGASKAQLSGNNPHGR
jgi:RNA polymerase sigma factor (sigma-70 family)